MGTEAKEIIQGAYTRLLETGTRLMEESLAEIQEAYIIIEDAVRNGKRFFACGNGGSAATEQHFVAELVGRYKRERGPISAESLSVNTSIITAVGNDYGFDQVFARQIEGNGHPKDVLVAFSTSGTSPNILNAIMAAKDKGLKVILVTGKAGRGHGQPDVYVAVPSLEIARIQEFHDFIIHVWCETLDANL